MASATFHPVVAQWFARRFGTPTDVQLQAWPAIAGGRHVLVTAPTGTGKTLAAFLVALDRLFRGDWSTGGLRVLYISPLKALNNDVRQNLLAPLGELLAAFRADALSPPELRVMVRSGDSTESERRQMRRHPPEILITTPESLSILLTQQGAGTLFSGLQLVIVDEIHAVIGSKRGTALLVGLERLADLAGEFQRVGLSATVQPTGLVGQAFAGWDASGAARALSLIESRTAKAYAVTVHLPPLGPEPDETGKVFWPGLAVELRRRTRDRASTLIFTNSRRACEKLARLMNENQEALVAYSHHGSLSKDVRREVEAKLKAGDLRALVATNSLELGIDIGDLDEVVLAQTPRTASSAIQKVGRAGHRIGEVSRARLYPSHGIDLVEAAVILRCIRDQSVEPVVIPEAPLDVLAQVLLSMLCPQPATPEELFSVVRRSWPYRRLSRSVFDLVMDQLAGRYEGTRLIELKPRIVAGEDGRWRAAPQVPFLLYSSGGTIPDRGYFALKDLRTGAPLGELDEEFVWERSLGDRFALGAQVWKIRAMDDQSVSAEPVDAPPHIIPFWKAEDQDRGWFLAEKVGLFLQEADEALSTDGVRWKRDLVAEGFDQDAADRLFQVLLRQREVLGALPHRWRFVVERVAPESGSRQDRPDADQYVLHTFWGARLNRPWAFALAQAWEDRFGYALETYPGDDQILVLVPPEADLSEALSLVTPANLEDLLRRRLETTGFFGARFREGAGRALLLPKSGFGRRTPLWQSRVKAKRLFDAVSRYPDFPVIVEAWRQCLRDEFELPELQARLDELATGRIATFACRTDRPSPFTEGLLWRQINTKMYDDDAPSARRTPSIADDLWSSFLGEERPRITAAAQADWEARWGRTAAGYAPENRNELEDLLEVRIALTPSEWDRLKAAVVRDQGPEALAWVEEVATVVRGGLLLHPRVAASQESGAETWLRWLESRGPVSLVQMAALWGQSLPELTEWARTRLGPGQLIVGKLTEGAQDDEVCRTAVWDQLVRRQKNDRRSLVNRQPLANLAGFLGRWQGLWSGATEPEQIRHRVGQLLGLSLPCGLWEASVLPVRLSTSNTSSWDDLFEAGGLRWFGTGPKQLGLGFADEAETWVPGALSPKPEASASAEELFGPLPTATLPDLAARTQLSTSVLTDRLWALAWEGQVSTTGWGPVRQGLSTGFRFAPDQESTRSGRGLQRWVSARVGAGVWQRHGWSGTKSSGVAGLETARKLARQVLDRYGVVFRTLLSRELPAFHWRNLFPALRLMELSGEVIGGLFWEGVAELQFALPEAVRLLEQDPSSESLWLQHAQDPSSLCGLGLEGQSKLPRRSEGTWLWWRGHHLVAVVSGQGTRWDSESPDEIPGGTEQALSTFVARQAALFWRGGALRWTLEAIDGLPAAESPRAPAFCQAGFRPHGDKLLLWKS